MISLLLVLLIPVSMALLGSITEKQSNDYPPDDDDWF